MNLPPFLVPCFKLLEPSSRERSRSLSSDLAYLAEVESLSRRSKKEAIMYASKPTRTSEKWYRKDNEMRMASETNLLTNEEFPRINSKKGKIRD